MTTQGGLVRGLERVQDPAVKEALRELSQRIYNIETAPESDGLSLSEIRTALRRGGSTPLDVTGLTGVLLRPQPGQSSRCALWYQTSASIAGAGSFTWDREVFSRAPDHYTRQNSNTEINFRTGGVFLIVANLNCSASATLNIEQDGVALAQAVGTIVSLTAVVKVTTGSRIAATNSTGNRVGNADGRTSLAVVRLA